MIAFLLVLIAFFGSALGTSSGESSVTTAPAARAAAPGVAVTQPTLGLAPAAEPCVRMLKTPCSARSRPKP